MVTCYTGTPGSGKSLHLAKDVLGFLKAGVDVIANFEVKTELIKHMKGKFIFVETENLTVNYLKQYALKNHDFKSKKEVQTQLIIDECSDIFNCRDFKADTRPGWLIFFRQHRKFRYNIILTTQDDKEIDKQIRNKIEEEVRHRKMNNFGFIGLLLSLFSFNRFKLFVALTFWKGNKRRTFVEYFLYRKKHGKLYDTFKIFTDEEFKALVVEGATGYPPTPKKEAKPVKNGKSIILDELGKPFFFNHTKGVVA